MVRQLDLLLDPALLHRCWDLTWNQWKHRLPTKIEVSGTFVRIRTAFEILTPQVFAYNLSLREGLNPDNPSPAGIINRVVQGIRIYD